MSEHATNGKATLGLALQTLVIIGSALAAIIAIYVKINSLEAKQDEIETQFRAGDEFRNINLASQMRFNSLLWQKAYGEPFPAEVYFPIITHK